MKRAYVDIPEGQMHYRYTGKGQPIVLLHMSGSSSDEFERVSEYLKDRFTVYAPDDLGFGYSDPPPKFYTLRDHAKTIISFMDALNIKKAIIAGNLVGANITARIAAEWPDRVSGVVLVDICYSANWEDMRQAIHLPIYQKVDLAADGSHLTEWWKRAAQYGEAVEYAEERFRCLVLAGIEEEALHWALFTDEDYGTIIPKINVPTLVVGAEKQGMSKVVPDVAGFIKNSKFAIIGGGNAYVARTHPKELAQLILDNF